MGAWGMKVFESDSTLDWLWDLEKSTNTSFLESAVNPPKTEYLEAAEGELILAASEIICGLRGKPREGLPEGAVTWISKNKNLDVAPLISKAIAGIKQVLSDQSELNDLWKESGDDYSKWVADVEQVQAMLENT